MKNESPKTDSKKLRSRIKAGGTIVCIVEETWAGKQTTCVKVS